MKKLMRQILTLGLSLVMVCTAHAASSVDVAALKAAETADQIVLVIGGKGSDATLSYHEKDGKGVWTEVFATPAIYGRNGSTADKKEGDGKTPQGVYSFTMAFGLKEDPTSILPYHKIIKGDFWVDDSSSLYYNKLVNLNTTKQAWNSAEDMISQAPYYNYGLALNYNPDCVPGKGSAIFLHCTGTKIDAGSAGCIRIPEERMKQLIQSVGETARIIIVDDMKQLEYQ